MPQNKIYKTPLKSLGYGFIEAPYLPKGKDEYYLRNLQNRNGINYRQLNAYEIEVLVRNRNTSDDWNKFLVSDLFNPELVKNCKFYGLVRIGKLESICLGFSDLKVPVGLYNSTIISCDFGDNVVIDNVHYLANYIIGTEVLITNVDEMVTTNHSKFGNGILKEGEEEDVRIWVELCNENTGRRVLPFVGMLSGDAYLWSKYKDDTILQEQFKSFTARQFKPNRGYYGKVGDRTVIKNTKIIKDVWVGTDAYIKGANKLKNLTINSGPEGTTQIGEGCEIVNGIIGFGCRLFYGIKAVRFVMADHSQLKYGARLINSYLGPNATISCCEVLNSLIFPAHEQHHNNSFLCAAVVMGQSNIAAGATIGSNHNSRGADGEVILGRGFWPGLCVSIKHNSKFASFTILAKGDYPTELNIKTPFSLVSIDASKDELIVMPAYWFLYNMYALARNAWKYVDRDKRTERTQFFEYDYLAPDTINEILASIKFLEIATGKAYQLSVNKDKIISEEEAATIGRNLLKSNNKLVDSLEILGEGFENSKRKVVFRKVLKAYHIFEEMVMMYGMTEILKLAKNKSIKDFDALIHALPTKTERNDWINLGGQLIPESEILTLRKKINTNKIKSWDEIHAFYETMGKQYDSQRCAHAFASMSELLGISLKKITKQQFNTLLGSMVSTKEWMAKGIYDSKAKDYSNPYRKMVYDTTAEMNAVVGKLEDNSFIKDQVAELKIFKKEIATFKKQFS